MDRPLISRHRMLPIFVLVSSSSLAWFPSGCAILLPFELAPSCPNAEKSKRYIEMINLSGIDSNRATNANVFSNSMFSTWGNPGVTILALYLSSAPSLVNSCCIISRPTKIFPTIREGSICHTSFLIIDFNSDIIALFQFSARKWFHEIYLVQPSYNRSFLALLDSFSESIYRS